jgi:Tol biopolymer transport system component
MTWLDGYRMRLVLVGMVAAIVLGSGNARADFTFGKPMNLGLPINTPYDEVGPSISTDGMSLYFSSTRPGGFGGASGDIWVTRRTTINDVWGIPVNLGSGVNSSSYEWTPNISANGLELHFGSARTGGYGTTDIWVTTRRTIDSDWGTPVNLGEVVNSSAHEESPSISSDGLELYFSGWKSPFRPGGHGNADLWMTTRLTKDDPWEKPMNLGALVNSSSQDARPCISADGLVLFFDSQRPGGHGYGDLYMTTRTSLSAPWKEPVNLGPKVNSSAFEELPSISADGRTLYFDRANASNWNDGSLWQVSITPIVDFTGDYRVDIEDLLILIEHWGQNEPAFDMGPMPWGDGIVDAADLEVLMRYWGQPVYDPHLLAHWKLDETEGHVAYDSAGENDATVTGDAAWESEGGYIGGALQFDGMDDCISTNIKLDPADGVFSVFAWVKGGAPDQVIISQKDGVDWLLTDTQGCLMTALQSNSGRIKSGPLISDVIITDGNWHQIGFIRDGSDRILYIDDIEVVRDTVKNLDSARGSLFIGVGSNLEVGTFWSGMIDDVRIYDRVVEP